MISSSEEVKQWGLELELTPDTIQSKVLNRPKIYETPNFIAQTSKSTPEECIKGPGTSVRVLDSAQPLQTMVHEPKNFERFAIFCLEKDVENAKYVNDKFFAISSAKGFEILVEYADICPVSDQSQY